jgi:predicted MFS family arabinose efflux permease
VSSRWPALALAAGAAVSVGIARFGYALVLPAMRTDLQLSYGAVGSLGTANAVGYLLGAVAVTAAVRRTGSRRLFRWGLWLTTLALLACACTRNLGWLAAWRVLAGVGAAATFISGGVLAGALGGSAIAVFFSGAGIGMVLTGLCVPWLFALSGAAAWPWSWALLGVISVPLSLAADRAASVAPDHAPRLDVSPWPWRKCVPELLAYGLFGLGYIAYMTFILALLRGAKHSATELAWIMSLTWCVLGAASIIAPRFWKALLGARKDGLPMACCMTALACGAAIPIIVPSMAGMLLSATLVGLSVFIVPAAATTFIKHNLVQDSWGIAISVATVIFAIGQALGPLVTGLLTDLTGSLSLGLAASSATLIVGAMVALIQKPIPPHHSQRSIHSV